MSFWSLIDDEIWISTQEWRTFLNYTAFEIFTTSRIEFWRFNSDLVPVIRFVNFLWNISLSATQNIILRLGGYIPITYWMRQGWKIGLFDELDSSIVVSVS